MPRQDRIDGLANLFGSRKARLWDMYLARWQAKTLRHDDGLAGAFMRYFGQCFDQAKEANALHRSISGQPEMSCPSSRYMSLKWRLAVPPDMRGLDRAGPGPKPGNETMSEQDPHRGHRGARRSHIVPSGVAAGHGFRRAARHDSGDPAAPHDSVDDLTVMRPGPSLRRAGEPGVRRRADSRSARRRRGNPTVQSLGIEARKRQPDHARRRAAPASARSVAHLAPALDGFVARPANRRRHRSLRAGAASLRGRRRGRATRRSSFCA